MTALILLSKFRETEIEIWRPVISENVITNAYEVSNLGRVRSYLQPPKGNQYSGKTRIRSDRPRLLTINTTKDRTDWRCGYGQVCLQTLGGERMFRVHLLVAKAFLPNPNNDTQVNHKTAVKCDNRVPNLEWSDHDRNHEHATRYGLRQAGTRHWNARLSESTVRLIRAEIAVGRRQVDVARRLGLPRHTVWRIVHGKNWSVVE